MFATPTTKAEVHVVRVVPERFVGRFVLLDRVSIIENISMAENLIMKLLS